MTSLSPPPPSFTLFTSQVNSKFRSLNPESVSTAAQTPRRSIIRLREDVWGPPKVVALSSNGPEEEKHEVGSNVTSRASNKKRRRNHWTPAAGGEQEEDSSGHQTEESRRVEETETLELHRSALPVRRRKRIRAGSGIAGLSPSKERSITEKEGQETAASRRDLSRHRSPSPRSRFNFPRSSGHAADILCRPIAAIQQGTTFADYEAYFFPGSTISPEFSYQFLHLQMKFIKSTVDHYLWSSQPQASAFIPPKFEPVNERLLKTQLDFRRIRQTFPIKKYVGPQRFVQESKLSKEHYPFKRALEWIYEEKLCYSRVDWFVENAPLPLLVLVRLHAARIRFSVAVQRAASEFGSCLSQQRLENLTVPQRRARQLVEWLTGSTGGYNSSRWRNWWIDEVVCYEEGRRSMTSRWMSEDSGWERIEDLESWENRKG